MIRFFTTAKPFRGHSAMIQRNALQSWKLLHPDAEVILFGDDEGTAEAACELGLRHEPHAQRHDSGLKYIHSMFDRAQEIARHDLLCYVNCDIVLVSDFLAASRMVRDTASRFLMVGRRWDTNVTEPLDFSNPRWQQEVRDIAKQTNDQRDGWWIDYFLFSRGLFHRTIPPFVIGRVRWDNWLIWNALDSRALVVDASEVVVAIHQNHDYSYHPGGKQGVWNDELAERNLALAGGWRHQCTIREANRILTPGGLKPNRARHWHAARRWLRLTCGFDEGVLIYKVWLPLWHFCLNVTRPVRTRLGLRSAIHKNSPRAGTLP